MNNFSKQNDNKKSINIFMLLVFVLFSNIAVFGQATVEDTNSQSSKIVNVEIVNNTIEISAVKQETAPNMNFALWFMASKHDPNVKITPSGENTRRQFMTSGMAPNRLLIKTFLKKAVNFEVASV